MAAASASRLALLLALAAGASAQWSQFTRCQISGTCVSYVLSFTGMQPDTWWSLGTTIPAGLAIAAALNDRANGINLGDIGTIVAGTQSTQVGNNYVLIQRTDNMNLIFRAGDPGVPDFNTDPKNGYFNGPYPGSATSAALLATTNVYMEYSGATTVAEANLIGQRIVANKVKLCADIINRLPSADPWMDGVDVAIKLPVAFPAGPTPLASAIPSVAAGKAATVSNILFVFNIYGVPSTTLASAAGRASLSSALAAAIMVGPNVVANSGSSTGAVSTGRAFDMSTIISSTLTPVTLALTSSGGSSVFYPTSRRLSGAAAATAAAEDEDEAGARSLQQAAPIEWHASVTFASPQVAFQVGKLLITNTIQWGTLLGTELTALDPTNFPAGTVQTGLAQPIMYP
jgi:hypothetical protein